MTTESEEDSIFYIDPNLKKKMWREMVDVFVNEKRTQPEEEGLEMAEIKTLITKLKKRLLRNKE